MSQRDPDQRREYIRALAAAKRGDMGPMRRYRARLESEKPLPTTLATDAEISAAIARIAPTDDRCASYEQQGGWRIRCFFSPGHGGACVFRRTA